MSTKTSIKRIALVAVSALGFGLLSVVPAKAASPTGTVSPVRVTFTGAVQDNTPTSQISWTTAAALSGDETAVLTLTTAPSASAKMEIKADVDTIGTSINTAVAMGAVGAGIDSLAGTGTELTISDWSFGNDSTNDIALGATARLGFEVDTSGTYAGTIAIWDQGANAVDTVSFSFTTRGAVSSFTFTSDVTETSPGGAITTTTTVLDSAGNVTQPLVVDTIDLTDNVTGSGSFVTTSLAATGGGANSLFDGVATSVYTNISTASSSATLTATPAGTLGTIAAKTIAVTTTSVTVDGTALSLAASLTVSTPSNAAAAAGSVIASPGSRTQAIPTGTADVSIAITGGVNSAVHRFSIVASAGTVDGTAYTTTVYKNVTMSSTGTGTLSFTLAGTATAVGATVTVDQVDVQNASLSRKIVLTQTNGAISPSTPTLSPSGGVVRAIGTSTDVTITVKDQYGTALGSGFVIRAYRGTNNTALANLLDTETTGADGTAVLTVTNVSGITSNTSETYTFTYTEPGVASATTITTTGPTITYTTGGTITSLSVTLTGAAGVTSPITNSTLDSAVTKYPAVVVPTDGTASDATGDQRYDVATSLVEDANGGVADHAEMFTLVADADANNTTTYTSTTGAFLSSTSSKAWDAGVSTLTVAEGATVYVYATKTGLHTITATSGGKTATIKFWAYNLPADAYNVSASAAATTLAPSANTIVTMTVKDVFGNVVDAADARLTATASDKVRLAGQALTQSLNTAADGTVQFTVVADATTGTGTVTMAPTGTETGSTNPFSSTYVKPTGAADPVKSFTLTFTVAGSTAKTNDEVFAEATAAKTEAAAATTAATTAGTKADAAKTEAAAATTAATTAGTKADAAKDEAALATAKAADALAEAKLATAAGKAAEAEAKLATAAADAAKAAATKAGTDAVAAADAAKAAATKAGTDAVAAAEAATDAALEAVDGAQAAADAASLAGDAADAATVAAEEARDAADAATAAAEAATVAAEEARDAAVEGIDAANAAIDAANLAAEAADNATIAAEEARDAALAATAAIEELATQVSTLLAALRAQLTTLGNTVAKIAKKVKA